MIGTLFEAVQAKLAASATARQLRLKASPAILAGRLFDDRGNRMTPTHTNKRGARYRYYVSHAILQKRKEEAGSVVARAGTRSGDRRGQGDAGTFRDWRQ